MLYYNWHVHYWFVLLKERARMFLLVCRICSHLVWEDASARGAVAGGSSLFFSRCVFCILVSQVAHVLIYFCDCYIHTFHAAVYTNT